jgi:hypothetical protein
MSQICTPVVRALVVATLLAATAAVLHVTVQTARAAGTLAVGTRGAFGEAYDFRNAKQAEESALAKCKVVATVKHGCAATAVDYTMHPNILLRHQWTRPSKPLPPNIRFATSDP